MVALLLSAGVEVNKRNEVSRLSEVDCVCVFFL